MVNRTPSNNRSTSRLHLRGTRLSTSPSIIERQPYKRRVKGSDGIYRTRKGWLYQGFDEARKFSQQEASLIHRAYHVYHCATIQELARWSRTTTYAIESLLGVKHKYSKSHNA